MLDELIELIQEDDMVELEEGERGFVTSSPARHRFRRLTSE